MAGGLKAGWHVVPVLVGKSPVRCSSIQPTAVKYSQVNSVLGFLLNLFHGFKVEGRENAEN